MGCTICYNVKVWISYIDTSWMFLYCRFIEKSCTFKTFWNHRIVISMLTKKKEFVVMTIRKWVFFSSTDGEKEKVAVVPTPLEKHYETDGVVNVSRSLCGRTRILHPKIAHPCPSIDCLLEYRTQMPKMVSIVLNFHLCYISPSIYLCTILFVYHLFVSLYGLTCGLVNIRCINVCDYLF